jgi:hypothetical protein
MPTPVDDLYTAAKSIMGVVNGLSSVVIVQAPTNYGDDFRIPNGTSMYQVHISRERDYHKGTVKHPRAVVSVSMHHRITDLANEELFLHDALSHLSDQFTANDLWRAGVRIYDLQPGLDPEMSEGSREGKVLSFEVSAVVLADAV